MVIKCALVEDIIGKSDVRSSSLMRMLNKVNVAKDGMADIPQSLYEAMRY